MKNIKKLSYAAALLVVTTAVSCNKQLQEYNPSGSTGESLFSNPAGFRTVVNMSYQDLHEFYGIADGMYMCESGTDLWYNIGKAATGGALTQYVGLAAGQAQMTSFWTYAYRGVNYCNTGIKYIDDAGLSSVEKPQRLGELRFLRALYNYHIVEQWGNVALVTKPGLDGAELNPIRSSVEAFYDLIISDLEYAKDNLPPTWPTADYSRASKKSAMGLLARVLLTRAYYSEGADATAWFTRAKNQAVEVINNKTSLGLDLLPKYSDLTTSIYGAPATRATNKEAMFVLAYNQDNPNANAWVTSRGNRMWKFMITRYAQKPGMANTGVIPYGWHDEAILMPTWHHLDLFDESKDSRYFANFQEAWIANQVHTWTTGNLKNSVNNLTWEKFAVPTNPTIAVGDTALFFTKKDWGGRTRDIRYLVNDKNDLYENPVSGAGTKIKTDAYTSTHFPSFKKWINPSRNTGSNYDFGDALIIRFAEMYMIAAEAAVKLNDGATAAQYVNAIRKRAAIPGQEAAMEVAPSAMNIEFILDERGREFGGEMQRWYDLKRVYHNREEWVKYINKYNPDIESIKTYHWVRPIPLSELNAITNADVFGQNPDYQ